MGVTEYHGTCHGVCVTLEEYIPDLFTDYRSGKIKLTLKIKCNLYFYVFIYETLELTSVNGKRTRLEYFIFPIQLTKK